MPAAVGARFGHYELLARIGAGGMGEVFRARDLDLQRDVAIKFLPAPYAADADRLARFAQEARAASALNHPNIVTIHEIGQAFGQPYIVMEHVDGLTLHDMIARGRLEPKRAVDLAAQVAEGLAKAHAAGIIHRDLKPENVMVTRDGFAKILDFGLAKLRVERESTRGATSASDDDDTRGGPETGLGVILGTVGYMSPEQAAGRPATPQSDQFSLGAIAYEMATGQRAFARPTSVQTLSAILESEPTPLQDLSPSFPVSARWIVERCLAKRPEDRYASTADLARDLRDVLQHFSEVSSGVRTSSIRRWAASPRLRRRGLLGATVVLALFGLLAVPAINDGVRSAIGLSRLPAEKRVAVLPIDCRGGTADEHQACEGMLDFLVGKLGELDRFQPANGLAVVPAIDIRQNADLTVDAVRTRLGANLAIVVTAERRQGQTDFVVTLTDTSLHRQLRSATGTLGAGSGSLLDAVLDAVLRLLDLELGKEASAVLHAGGAGVVEAASLYAQGLQATPYQVARTALERYDQRQSLEQAIVFFNKALELDPKYALAHAGLGEAYFRLFRLTREPAQIELAERHCQRALELDDLVGRVWQTLGNVHAETGKLEVALTDLDKALVRAPRNAEIFRDRAAVYAKLGRQKEAEEEYRKAVALPSPSWSIYSYYGAFLYAQNRYAEAESALKQGLRLAPDNTRLLNSLGAACYAQGRFNDAEAAFRRSLAISPTGSAASNLATFQFDAGDYTAAARNLEEASKLSPRDYRVWRNLGAAYYWAPGERPSAASAYRTALTLAEEEHRVDPRNGRPVIEAADCAAMLGDKAKALTLIEEALRLAPEDTWVQFMAGDVYETLGNRGAALRLFEAALRAGYPRSEIERSPSLSKLRNDPRYKQMIAAIPTAPSDSR